MKCTIIATTATTSKMWMPNEATFQTNFASTQNTRSKSPSPISMQ